MKPAPRHTHPLVRALAWLIGSPGLLSAAANGDVGVVDDAWCARQLAASHAWLAAQDADPRVLEEFIALRKVRRLGFLAEALLAFWLRNCGRFELLAENLVVREGGRTLGDFDLLLRERDGGDAVHWELSVKFYLRLPGADGLAAYVGPAGRDTLATKADRVLTRQLGLGHTAAGRAALASLGIERIVARAFVKGWLFYPLGTPAGATPGLNPAHGRGWWRRHVADTADNWSMPGRAYRIVDRLEWLAWPGIAGSTLDWRELQLRLRTHFATAAGALMVVEFESHAAQAIETSRGFVMPPDWVGASAAN